MKGENKILLLNLLMIKKHILRTLKSKRQYRHGNRKRIGMYKHRKTVPKVYQSPKTKTYNREENYPFSRKCLIVLCKTEISIYGK